MKAVECPFCGHFCAPDELELMQAPQHSQFIRLMPLKCKLQGEIKGCRAPFVTWPK